jgi:hypothetical protein
MSVKTVSILAITCLLAACGGGSGSSGSVAPPTSSADPGGIWTGTDSGTGLAVTALIAESGQAQVIRADGAQYFGNVTVSGNSLSGTLSGVAPFGTTFPDGSRHGTGKFTGTLAEHSSIQATVTFTTDNGETSTGTSSLTFQSLYEGIANVANFAGTWTDTNNGVAVSITSGGAIFVQDSNTGCVINGQIDVVQANYNLWAASIDYANCQGPAAALNGIEFAGMVELNGNGILAGFRDKSGKNYGLVFSLTKQ